MSKKSLKEKWKTESLPRIQRQAYQYLIFGFVIIITAIILHFYFPEIGEIIVKRKNSTYSLESFLGLIGVITVGLGLIGLITRNKDKTSEIEPNYQN